MICNNFRRFGRLATALRRLCVGTTRAPMHPQELIFVHYLLAMHGPRSGHGAGRVEFERLQWRPRISYRICL